MNEILFFFHVISVVFFLFLAFRLGKEALFSFICLQGIFANLFVIKQMSLFGLEVTCSDVFAVGGMLGLNLLQEFYGRSVAKKAIWSSFCLAIFFGGMSYIHLLYTPSLHDNAHLHYVSILSNAPRLIAASFFVYLVVQLLDVRFFGFLRKIFNGRHLALRSGISLVFMQALDTALFTLLGLYGLVTSVLAVFCVSFVVKIVIISLSTPFMSIASKVAKKEHI